MNRKQAIRILTISFAALPLPMLRRLVEHVRRKTPILCGRKEAGDHWVVDGVG